MMITQLLSDTLYGLPAQTLGNYRLETLNIVITICDKNHFLTEFLALILAAAVVSFGRVQTHLTKFEGPQNFQNFCRSVQNFPDVSISVIYENFGCTKKATKIEIFFLQKMSESTVELIQKVGHANCDECLCYH